MKEEIISQDFEVIGIDIQTKRKMQYSVCAKDTTEAKSILHYIKPNFDIKIIYPSKFEQQICNR